MNTATAHSTNSQAYKNWLNSLVKCKNELIKMEENLGKLANGIKHKQLLLKVEQFQNRFIRQKEVIDELKHDIKQYENHLEEGYLNEMELQVEFYNLKEQFNRFYDLFIELERDFDEFAA